MVAQGEKLRERVLVIYGVDLFVYLVVMTKTMIDSRWCALTIPKISILGIVKHVRINGEKPVPDPK